MLSRKADQFILASRDTGHGQLLSVAISWANEINFNFGVNMASFSSDSHIFSFSLHTLSKHKIYIPSKSNALDKSSYYNCYIY